MGMMTESDALSLWCPMVRVGRDEESLGCCIGSRCAMWRWGTLTLSGEGVEYFRTRSLAYQYAHKWPDGCVEVAGYCGLAGPLVPV